MYVRAYVRTYVCMYVCTYIRMYACIKAAYVCNPYNHNSNTYDMSRLLHNVVVLVMLYVLC